MIHYDKTSKKKSGVQYLTVSDEYEGQRIDNFLVTRLKGMPKSRIYRILRKGEVRVNKKRVSAFYRLAVGDMVRLPPVFLEQQAQFVPPSKDTTTLLAKRILYEDDNLLILNKPSGMSVHIGSTVRVGVVEALRHMYPKLVQLELAPRLDLEKTRGCFFFFKKKKIFYFLYYFLLF